MPSRTLEDKVNELSKLVAALREQVREARTEIKELRSKQSETAQQAADLITRMAVQERQAIEWGYIKEEVASLRDLKIPIAVLERAVEELKRTKEEWSRRFWAMAGPILGALRKSVAYASGSSSKVSVALKVCSAFGSDAPRR